MINTEEKNKILINTNKGLIEIPETYYWVKDDKKILKKDAILQLQRILKFKFEEPEIEEDFRDKPFSTVVVGLKTEEGKVIYGVGSGNYMNLLGFGVDIPTDMAYKRAKSNAAIEYLSSISIDSTFYSNEEKEIHNNIILATKDLVFNIEDKEVVITPNEYYIIELFDDFSQTVKQMNIFNKRGILKIQKSLNLEFGKPIIKETINYSKSANGVLVPRQFVTIKTPLITEEGVFGYGVGTASPNNLDKVLGIKFAPEMAYKRSKANIVIEYLKYVSQTDLLIYSENDYFNFKNNTNNNTTNNNNTNNNTNNNKTNNNSTNNNKTNNNSTTTKIINNNEIITEKIINEKSISDVFSSFKSSLDKENKKESPIKFTDFNKTDGINTSYHFDDENPKKEIQNNVFEEDLGKKELRGIAKYSEGITIEDFVKKDKKMIENMYKRFGNLKDGEIIDESSRKWFDIFNDIKEYFNTKNMTIEEYLK